MILTLQFLFYRLYCIILWMDMMTMPKQINNKM